MMDLSCEKDSLGEEFLVTRRVLVGKEKAVAEVRAKNKESRKPVGKFRRRFQKDGVIYLGHIPAELDESGLKAFLKQFGKVERLRLARCKKSGKSKGYAFIQYEYNEVAKTVAETLNNYLIRNKLLKCEMVPRTKVVPQMFMSSDPTKNGKRMKAVGKEHDRFKLPNEVERNQSKAWRKLQAKKLALGKLGIDIKEKDILDPTEKITETDPVEGTDGGKFKKAKPPKNPLEAQKKKAKEEAEEAAIRAELETLTPLKSLMEQLKKCSADGVDDDDDDAVMDTNDDSAIDTDEEEMSTTADEDDNEGEFEGDEVRVFEDDPEIQFKTPPGLKKRKMRKSTPDSNKAASKKSPDGKPKKLLESGKKLKKGTPKSTGKKFLESGKKSKENTPKSTGKKIKKTAPQSTGKKPKDKSTGRERTKSAPAEPLFLASKKIKPSAFLNRSLNKGQRKGFKEAE
ncbi:unnamed protein product [Notodromas monacha]|uniref:RRM domain-containing protein n=1 Tax=Notodromas monacha TaxID=399045 RepID=A0A7R9GBL5_9CRUS|nr:unnamed protein product [Notodromas monacha]CAG0916502.1 unnamed protein product [Notodromas monacha]